MLLSFSHLSDLIAQISHPTMPTFRVFLIGQWMALQQFCGWFMAALNIKVLKTQFSVSFILLVITLNMNVDFPGNIKACILISFGNIAESVASKPARFHHISSTWSLHEIIKKTFSYPQIATLWDLSKQGNTVILPQLLLSWNNSKIKNTIRLSQSQSKNIILGNWD